MKDDDARLTPEEEEELIGAVIRRTSGGACARAEELLAERQSWSFAPHLRGTADARRETRDTPEDAKLELCATPEASATELALLDAHLEHCSACAALARSLAVARDTLPSLASFDPGPSFTAAVLAATSRAEPVTVAERLTAWWNAWLARPRFALEAAYVATLLILVVAGNPAATLQAASSRTVNVAAASFDRARDAWPAAISRVAPAAIELPESVRALGSTTSGLVERGSVVTGGLTGAWSRALSQWAVAWGWLRGVAGDLVTRVSGGLASVQNLVGQWFNRPPTEPRVRGAR